MVSKAKRRNNRKKKNSTADRRTRTRRLLEKGDCRDALKEARLCFREEPSDEHRRLLEFAHMARAEELQRHDQLEACQGVLTSLLDLGVREEAVKAALPAVALWAGMAARLPADLQPDTEDQRQQWDNRLADHAVRNPDAAAGSPEILRQAQQVREALTALAAGNESEATNLLRDIPRSSPLADWKFFVRGLAGYYARDPAGMADNWQRLDSERVASKIAARLQNADTAVVSADAGSPDWRRLERTVLRCLVSTPLADLTDQMDEDSWEETFDRFKRLRPALEKVDAVAAETLYRHLVGELFEDADMEGLEWVTKRYPGLLDDPKWERFWANHADDHDSFEEARAFWKNYAVTLARLPRSISGDRGLDQALVQHRIGEIELRLALRLLACRCGKSHDEDIAELEADAVGSFQRAMVEAPSFREPYDDLIDLQSTSGRGDHVATCLAAVRQFPDHVDARRHLAEYYLSQRQADKAERWAAELKRLQPRDKVANGLLLDAHVMQAIEAARDDLSAARARMDEIGAQAGDANAWLARRIVFAQATGDDRGAAKIARELTRQAGHQALGWLHAAVAAAALQHSQQFNDYVDKFSVSLRPPFKTKVAGAVCRQLIDHPDLPAEDRLGQITLDYLKLEKRSRWEESDLRSVCLFLEDQGHDLAVRFATKGIKKFKLAVYYAVAGIAEYDKGPMACNARKAFGWLEKAEKQINDGDETVPAELRDAIMPAMNTLRLHLLDARFGKGLLAGVREGLLERLGGLS